MKQTEQIFLREDAARTERHAEFTEGVTDFYQKCVIEQLMDNASISEADMVAEDNSTNSVAVFTKTARPLIRRIYPALVANDLVSIQPMTLPTTKVFYMDFLYESNKGSTRKGDRNDFEVGNKFAKFYASGVVKGEVLGTGTGALVNFQTEIFPLKAGSLVVYVNSTPVTTYTINETTGAIVFTSGTPASGATVVADYAVDMEQIGSIGNTTIPELSLQMTSATVDAQEWKLKTKWTLEGQQDLRAYHNEDMEELLTAQMGDELRREIDRIIIDDLFNAASAGTTTWHYTPNAGESVKDHNETLIHAIGDISNEIYKKRQVHASFVVMGPDTLNRLDKTNTFRLTSGAGQDGGKTTAQLAAGPNVFGTLSNRYNVIVDPLFAANQILVGYKGVNWNETGYVYSPYTAFQTQTFIDPNTMKPVKGLMSRAGRHLVNGDYYGTVSIAA